MVKNKAEANKGHIVFVYESIEERQRFITDYFKEALDNGCLCIFVAVSPQATIIEDFKKYGLDITRAVERNTFKIFNMQETYLPNGEFAANYMLSNVEQFIKDAERDGYNGIYTAGEMTWLCNKPMNWPQAVLYESQINDLQAKHQQFKGLCLYPSNRSEFIESLALATHPVKVLNGSVLSNANYASAVA